MLPAVGCPNGFLSKGGQQKESSRTIILDRRLSIEKAAPSKASNTTDFIPRPAVYRLE